MMSQTTTPSGADVDPLVVIDDLIEWAKAAGVLDYKDRCDLIKTLESAGQARTAVAALITRNAEIEAERDAGKFRSTNRDVTLSDPRPLAERLPSYARQFGNETIFAKTIAALLLEAHTALADCDELRKMAVSALNASDADLAALLAESGEMAAKNKALREALIDVRDNVRGDSPEMWHRVDAAIALGEARSDG